MTKTIKIEDDVHKLLEDFGNKGETFSEIIKRAIKTNEVK